MFVLNVRWGYLAVVYIFCKKSDHFISKWSLYIPLKA